MKSKIIQATMCVVFLSTGVVYGQVACPDLSNWKGEPIQGWTVGKNTGNSSTKWKPHDAWILATQAKCNFIGSNSSIRLELDRDSITYPAYAFAGGIPVTVNSKVECKEGGCTIRRDTKEGGYHCQFPAGTAVFPVGCSMIAVPPQLKPPTKPKSK
ncbi:MAG TPA: hypothetical protein VMW10_01210 [Alphaproteobacteria bacterium]|nr:hypothetical protein [Alphaproteobacteria bacterium]